MVRCWGVATYKLKSPRQPASTARCWCCLWAVKRSPPPLKHHYLSIFLHAPHASMRTDVSCPHRTLHITYRVIAGAAPPAGNNTAARGTGAGVYLRASWPLKSPLPWLLGGPLQRARRSHVTCLALAGPVRARSAGGRPGCSFFAEPEFRRNPEFPEFRRSGNFDRNPKFPEFRCPGALQPP